MRRWALAAAGTFLASTSAWCDDRDGAFWPGPSLSFGRYQAAAGVLDDGAVLLYGPSYDADAFDARQGIFAEAGTIPAPRFLADLIALPGGDAMVIAGTSSDARSVRYDASARTWSWGPPMSQPRAHPQVAVLQDGRVLIAGGYGADGMPLATAELFDPTTETFSPTGSMPRPREGGIAHRLHDGRVLVAGGVGTDGYADLCATLYNPVGGTFAPGACFYIPAQGHYQPASALLDDGRVLLSGGMLFTGPDTQQVSTDAELYDPASNTWSSQYVGGRVEHSMTVLPNGNVLIVGGKDGWNTPLSSTEVFEPLTGRFHPGPLLATARFGHTANLLPGNRVLVAGGRIAGGGWTTTAELYVGDGLFTDGFQQ